MQIDAVDAGRDVQAERLLHEAERLLRDSEEERVSRNAMPYASQAQRAKFHQLAKEHKISPRVVAEFDKASKGMKLPKRVKPKKR